MSSLMVAGVCKETFLCHLCVGFVTHLHTILSRLQLPVWWLIKSITASTGWDDLSRMNLAFVCMALYNIFSDYQYRP